MDHRRTAVAVLAAGALGFAVWAWATDDPAAAGIAVRSGLILAALWVAWPSLVAVSARSWAITGLAAIAILWRPRAAWLVIPVLLVTLARRPRVP